ncbi:hypothetical protein [Enterococcus malodoratus]|uniref:hypothetical protein n=1 Tax=Enterococcus malodoratus TaxID=71451 RepID=UPI0022E77158|nr:hypothetical protein [Enterococcus malodoratus]
MNQTFYEKLEELLNDQNIIPVEWSGGPYEEDGETLINANFVYKTKKLPLSKQELKEKELLEMYKSTFSGHEQQLVLTAAATYTRLAKSYEKEEIQAIAEILKVLVTVPNYLNV